MLRDCDSDLLIGGLPFSTWRKLQCNDKLSGLDVLTILALRQKLDMKEKKIKSNNIPCYKRAYMLAARCLDEDVNESKRWIETQQHEPPAFQEKKKKQKRKYEETSESLPTSVIDNLRQMGSRVQVRKIEGKGRGLVATRLIPKRTFVTAMLGERIQPRDLDLAPEREFYQVSVGRGPVKRVYAPSLEEIRDPDPDLRVAAHFANHAFRRENQNSVLTALDKQSLQKAFTDTQLRNRVIGVLEATRDIPAGSEVLWDYGYDDYPREWSRSL